MLVLLGKNWISKYLSTCTSSYVSILYSQGNLQRLTKGISTSGFVASLRCISTFFVQSTRGSTKLFWMCIKRFVSNSDLCVFLFTRYSNSVYSGHVHYLESTLVGQTFRVEKDLCLARIIFYLIRLCEQGKHKWSS